MWTSTQAASGATCHQRGKVAHLGRGAPTQRTGTGTQDSGATVPWRSRVAPKNRQQCSAISLEPEAHSPKGREIPGQPASSPGSTPRARTALGGAAWQPWPPSLLAPPPPPPALWFYVFGCCSLSLHLLRANTPHGQPGAQCRVLGPERPVDTLCGCFHCLKIFSPSEITSWLEEGSGTAICPYCGIDAVIGESAGHPITAAFLKKMNKHFF